MTIGQTRIAVTQTTEREEDECLNTVKLTDLVDVWLGNEKEKGGLSLADWEEKKESKSRFGF